MTTTLTSTDLDSDRCPKCGDPITLTKRPVAWRVRTLGGWILYNDEEAALKYANDFDLEMQGLYARDGT